MKILHYTNQFYTPSQTFIIDLIKSTQYIVTDVQICTHNQIVKDVSVPIHDLSLNGKSYLHRKLINKLNKWQGLSHNTNFKKAKQVISQYSPDIVHSHFGTAAFYFHAIQKRFNFNIPQVISFHGYDVFLKDSLFKSYSNYFKEIAQKDNVIFTTPSQYLKNIVIKEMGIEPDKIKVVYNGFNNNLFTPQIITYENKDKLLISNVGRFINWKGQRYIIEALSILKHKGITNIQVDFIGDGEELESCIALANKLGVNNQCVFHGVLPHGDVANVISNSHLYVHSAITATNGQTETFGVAILEAIAMGKPTVFFNAGGIPEVFGSTSSQYYIGINEKDPNALADTILDMKKRLINLDKAQLLKASKIITSQFNNENCSKQILDIYKILAIK